MDLNTVLGIASLIAIVLGALAGVMALGRKDQQLENVRETAANAEARAVALEAKVATLETKHAVLEAHHDALCKRVSSIEESRGVCRLPHNHQD